MRIKKKRAFTLTEILISLGLFSIILATLFSSFRSASLLQFKGEKGRALSLTRSHLQQRLNQVFFYSDKSSFKEEEDESTGMKILSFSFDNHIDPDPLYSSMIKGKLYIDRKDQLILETAPLTPSEEKREEILCRGVSSWNPLLEDQLLSIEIDEIPFVFLFPKIDQKGFQL